VEERRCRERDVDGGTEVVIVPHRDAPLALVIMAIGLAGLAAYASSDPRATPGFLAILWSFALVMAYLAAHELLGTVVVTIDRDGLRRRSRPIPTPFAYALPLAELDDFAFEENGYPTSSGGRYRCWDLMVYTTSGRSRAVATFLRAEDARRARARLLAILAAVRGEPRGRVVGGAGVDGAEPGDG
jgi:hypothetical protein